jgi:hypothetical protein
LHGSSTREGAVGGTFGAKDKKGRVINIGEVLGNQHSTLFLTYHRNRATGSIRITSVRFFATANGKVVRYSTVGVNATCSHAWIHASILKAVLITGTVCVQNTFWPTRTVGIAYVTSRAYAIDGSILRFALGVGATRVWIARSRWLDDIWFDYFLNYIKRPRN